MQKMVNQFLGTRESKGPRGTLEPTDPSKRKRAKHEVTLLENTTTQGKEQALQVVAGSPGFPVYYPTRRTLNALFVPPPRVYDIKVGRQRYRSYRIVIRRDKSIGEYYGLQGTTWRDPPLLREPDQTKKYGKRKFDVYYDGDRVRLVAWRTPQGVYWVSNTLLQTLSKKQMLSIARTARVLGR
jgi:hypothetical protein